MDRLLDTRETCVVVIGSDGLAYSLVTNLHAIAETASDTAVEGMVPPASRARWPSVTTGTTPGTTGVAGGQDRQWESSDTYVPVGMHVEGERAWDRVVEAGQRSTVDHVHFR